jgi:hemoglobin
MRSTPRDLDTPEAIAELVDAFYRKVLADARLRPLFVDVAGIELEAHVPRIRAYWRKLLLGERGDYRRNMVARHLALHGRCPLRHEDFVRWLVLFRETVDERFTGANARRALTLAATIAGNLERLTRPACTQRSL